MKRRVFELSVCTLFFAAALIAYIVMFPSGKDVIELASHEDSENLYKNEDGIDYVGEGITVVSVPKSAERGSQVTVSFVGDPNTEYQIRVYYASGLSESKSFAPVVSDADGKFLWTWKISPNARVGEIRIIVTCDDSRVSFPMKILSKAD